MDPRRRALFRLAVDEVVAFMEESSGRRSFRLSDLGRVPDEQLGQLVPAIMDASQVHVLNGHAVVRRGDSEDVLYAVDSLDADVWPRIDARASISDIAAELAPKWAISDEAAFARVRRVFLTLVGSGVCQPLNPLD